MLTGPLATILGGAGDLVGNVGDLVVDLLTGLGL